MNLFFGGHLGTLMRPYMYKRISPFNLIRSQIRQNIFCKISNFHDHFIIISLNLGAASKSVALQHEIVQRTMGQFNDHNYEEMDGLFTRPTLDLYIANKYWNFITKGLSKEEIADLEKAR